MLTTIKWYFSFCRISNFLIFNCHWCEIEEKLKLPLNNEIKSEDFPEKGRRGGVSSAKVIIFQFFHVEKVPFLKWKTEKLRAYFFVITNFIELELFLWDEEKCNCSLGPGKFYGIIYFLYICCLYLKWRIGFKGIGFSVLGLELVF